MARIRKDCDNCQFFFQAKGDTNVGVCRRYPPTVKVFCDADGSIVETTSCPQVSIDHWCGDWEKIEDASFENGRIR